MSSTDLQQKAGLVVFEGIKSPPKKISFTVLNLKEKVNR